MIITLPDSRGDLDETPTYERRSWQWRAAYPGETDRDGTLVIMLTTVSKRRTRTTFHYYAVQVEWEYVVDFGLASFLLENEREADPDGPFRCVVGGMVQTCGCEAGNFDRVRTDPTSCKHRDALADLCAKGVI